MLSGLILENFKAFQERQEIDLAPITLIFGANSSGKTSLIQSLLLAIQTELDGPRAAIGDKWKILKPIGTRVDLDSYRNFVNSHDIEKTITIGWRCQSAVEDEQWDPYTHVSPLSKLGVENIADAIRYLVGWLNSVSNPESKGRPYSYGLDISYQLQNTSRSILPTAVSLFIDDENSPSLIFNIDSDQREASLSVVNEKGRYCTAVTGYIERVVRNAALEKLIGVHGWISDINDPMGSVLEESSSFSKFWHSIGVLSYQDEMLAINPKIIKDWFAQRMRGLLEDAIYLFRSLDASLVAEVAMLSYEYRCSYWSRDMGENIVVDVLSQVTEANPSQVLQAAKYLLALVLFQPEEMNVFTSTNAWIRNPFGDEDLLTPDAVLSVISQAITKEAHNILHLGPVRELGDRWVREGDTRGAVFGEGESMEQLLYGDESLIGSVKDALGLLGISYTPTVYRVEDQVGESLLGLRFRENDSDVVVSMKDLGYGVGQVMPVILTSAVESDKMIIIEQPELHLHPKTQAELGSLFAESLRRGNRFLIETHSEHLILRLQRLVKRGELSPNQVSVLYVRRLNGESLIDKLDLNERGDFSQPWPGGFFEESFEEIFGDLISQIEDWEFSAEEGIDD